MKMYVLGQRVGNNQGKGRMQRLRNAGYWMENQKEMTMEIVGRGRLIEFPH
jgi:hypothetical protein